MCIYIYIYVYICVYIYIHRNCKSLPSFSSRSQAQTGMNLFMKNLLSKIVVDEEEGWTMEPSKTTGQLHPMENLAYAPGARLKGSSHWPFAYCHPSVRSQKKIVDEATEKSENCQRNCLTGP